MPQTKTETQAQGQPQTKSKTRTLPSSALPAGPRSPWVLQTFGWIRSPFRFMRRAASRYGDAFTARLGGGGRPLVMLSAPEDLRTLLNQDDGDPFDAPGDLNALFEPFLGTESVIGISGDRHRRMRRLLMPPFHGERMRSYGQTIAQISDAVIDGWPVGTTFSAQKAMQVISMRVILSTVFGLAEGERYRELERLLVALLDQMSSPASVSLLYFPLLRLDLGPLSPWGGFVRRRAAIDALINDEIERRRRQPEAFEVSSDILSLLLAARDEQGQPMTDQELRDELMTLLVAGHETTATALTWALYWLHRRPELRLRLQQELAGVDAAADPTAVLSLPYLAAVCNETLRIYPVGMLTFPRVVRRPVTLAGQRLEPDTLVIGSIYLAHRRPAVYPDPETFRPERFLETSYSPYEFLPFGGGSRRCIGMAFAQYEMKVVLSRILSRASLELDATHAAHPVRRGLTSGASPVRLRRTGSPHSQG
ncbi:cytochrome P450 [Synechococcus sp. CCY9202]|uniref:cytochrome P450 n=1 Tax=Synechococcus sp. CCY9202 TaxID=174698 RepID=UPI002B20FBF3|nr:cytochrome P450 [Synechococcus sp. CCY9202]MEA5423599.1 cytochrome P450 [Synechococcus sp. CCY9202]